MDTLKRHLPFFGDEGLNELKKIAERFEEKVCSAATSQSDYLRKISLKMLSMKPKSQNAMPSSFLSKSTGNRSKHTKPGRKQKKCISSKKKSLESKGRFGENSMDTNNWRPTPSGGEPSMDTADWRNQLPPDLRQSTVNQVMDTLKRHLPHSGEEGLNEIKKIAERFEEMVYTAATSQSDYLRKISLKMLLMESNSQNTMPPNSAGNSSKPPDPA